MILKINPKAAENQYDSSFIVSTIKKMANILPKGYVAELRSFIRRNALGEMDNGSPSKVSYYCPQCLKAHALKTAEEMNLDNEFIELIKEVFYIP